MILGEDVLEVAVREVFEETGVRCRPHSVLGFRQHHNSRFGQSDMYFICRLEPETVEIIPCPTEIQAAKWMPVCITFNALLRLSEELNPKSFFLSLKDERVFRVALLQGSVQSVTR